MKSLFLFLLLYVGVAHAAGHHHDQPSVHGMLMLGESKIYLSHLPMFHSPHDYQVILEVELSAQGKAVYLSSQSSSTEKVYTLVPEVFVLPEMIESPRPFQAQIFRGHFERGGKMIADHVTVEIKKVIYFRKFDAAAVQPKKGQYFLFGNEQEQFLAHAITAKPDFDQLMEVRVVKEIVDRITKSHFISLELPQVANTKPLVAPSVVMALDPVQRPVPLNLTTEVYLEHGDLSF